MLLINEAIAAAIGAGLPIREPMASMVCAIGGGTTEVAVLSVGDVVAATSVRVGGDRMDQTIVDHLRRRHDLRIGLATAEQLRIEIGSAAPLDEELSCEVRGIDVNTGLPHSVPMTSDELRLALAGPLDDIVDALRSALDGCTHDLAADLVEHGMILTGGGALLRNLDRLVEQRVGVPARVVPEPLTTVLTGMLTVLEHLSSWQQMLESSDDDV